MAGNQQWADENVQGEALEALLAEIMVAVLSLEYGAVTVSVKSGHVTQIERHEKRRLGRPAAEPFSPEAYAS